MAAMAVEPCEKEFDAWLGGKLRDLNTDDGVFGSYIKGILIGDESNDEKAEALEGIISEITENDISELCQEILAQWQKAAKSRQTLDSTTEDDVENKLVKLLESQTIQTVQQRNYTDEEKRLREAILSQYSQIQVQEECDFEDGDGDDIEIERNTNVSSIQQAERERREQAKLDSQKKKDKDKEDREKQKQQQAERKEKRKTQKQERRR